MVQDNAPAFTAGPAAFILPHPVVLVDLAPPGGGFPVVNNRRNYFTLSTQTLNGTPAPNAFPSLRLQPPGAAMALPGGGAPVVRLPCGGVLTTLDAYYAHAGDGHTAFNALPICDIPIVPAAGDARLLFTTGMNGCSVVVATAVPPAAAPLPPGHWRVMHDHDHRPLAQWAAAGYTLHFATYADAGEPGPVPPGWGGGCIVNVYNPHNYPWQQVAPFAVRVVTNFLCWTGANWTFNSRHFHAAGVLAYDIDSPPGVVPPVQSTQTVML